MENQSDRPGGVNAQHALKIYVAVCAILVLIILCGAFERTDGGALSGEIYLRPAAGDHSGK